MTDTAKILRMLKTLNLDPSESNFDLICRYFEELWEVSEIEACKCLPGILQALDSWSDSHRVCPDFWLTEFAGGIHVQKFALVRTINSRGILEIADSVGLEALIGSPNLAYVLRLDLKLIDEDFDSSKDQLTPAHIRSLASRNDVRLDAIDLPAIDIESLRALLRSPVLQNCRHLGFEWADIDPNPIIDELVHPDCTLVLDSLNLSRTAHGPVGYPVFLSDASLNKFIDSPASKRISSLRIAGYHLTENSIKHLANARNTGNLRQLEISSICKRQGRDIPIQELANSTSFRHLSQIIYTDSEAGDASAELIASTRHLGEELNHLELDNQVGAQGALALAESRFLANLVHLSLRGNPKIGEPGCLTMARSHWMPNLNHLDLCCVGMTNSGLDAILSSLGNPEFLDFGCNRLNRGAFSSIGNCRHLPSVKTLYLRSSEFDDQEISCFASSGYLKAVQRLDLSYSQQQNVDGLIIAMANSKTWSQLRWLDLSGCKTLSDEAVLAIANSPHMRRLEVLRLGHNKITSIGVTAFASSTNLASLTSLDLRDNCICDNGLIALAKSESARKLKKLDMCGNQLTSTSRSALERSPLSNIKILKLSRHYSDLPNGVPGLSVSFSRIPGVDSWEAS